jgi:hypothetical protein
MLLQTGHVFGLLTEDSQNTQAKSGGVFAIVAA